MRVTEPRFSGGDEGVGLGAAVIAGEGSDDAESSVARRAADSTTDGEIASFGIFPREGRGAGETREKRGKGREFVDDIGRDALGYGEVVDDGGVGVARIEFVEVDIREGAVGCAEIDTDDVSDGDFLLRFA